MKQFLFLLLIGVFFTVACKQKDKTQESSSQPETVLKAGSIEFPHTFKYEGNPLVRYQSATDPNAVVWDDKVWVYCSQDHPKTEGQGAYAVMDGYHVYSTTDMVNWTDHGEIMHSRDISWGIDGWLWAPGVARKDGTYYLYYPHKDTTETWRIGVATGASPTGPFTDVGKYIEGTQGIDPMVFIDDDGEAYLYWNIDGESFNFNNSTRMARLKPNMIELAEEVQKIDYAPKHVMETDTLRFLEGAFVNKIGDKYYFSYTNWQNGTHQGFYCIGDSPYGPFEWKGPMAPKPKDAQDHHSMIEYKGQWYYFYQIGAHDLKPEGYDGSRRVACFDSLFFNEDGTIQMVKHTR